MILHAVLPWVAGALLLALLPCAWRLVKGPTLPDRILALDALALNSVALLVVLGLVNASRIYAELALLIALLGFVSCVLLCRFILRGAVVE